jgi:regulator of protease activity HflC (stomatin/prohibitin superfamily)
MGLIQFAIALVAIALGAVLVMTVGLRRERSVVVGVNAGPIILAGVALALAFFIDGSFGEIGAGERGVVKRFGAVTGQTLNPGLYTILPVINSVDRCNVQVQAYVTEAEAVSNNLQNVKTKVTLNYHQRPDACQLVVRDLNNDVQARIIVPGIQESVKAATAQYSAQQLISQRPAVRDQIEKALSVRLSQFGAAVDALSITQFEFSAEYTKAIETKAVVEQQVQQAQLELQQVAINAQQKVKQAQADAEAVVLNAQANAKAIELNGAAQAKALEYQKTAVTPELVRLR